MTSLWEILVTRYPRISDRLWVRRDDHPLILCTRVTVRVCSGDSKPQRDTEQTTPLWADSAQNQTDTLQPSNPRATIASETWRRGEGGRQINYRWLRKLLRLSIAPPPPSHPHPIQRRTILANGTDGDSLLRYYHNAATATGRHSHQHHSCRDR